MRVSSVRFRPLAPSYIIVLEVALVVLITLINLRGVRESGSILAFPTYFFCGDCPVAHHRRGIKAFVVGHQPLIGQFAPLTQTEPLTVFLLLRAFATGCSAMTGVEAISNGIAAFQKPETRNAATTLTWMAAGESDSGGRYASADYRITLSRAGASPAGLH